MLHIEIVRQLNEVSQSIISRISDLDVWNSANIAIYNEAVIYSNAYSLYTIAS